MAFQDKEFRLNSQLYYPTPEDDNYVYPTEFFGTIPVVSRWRRELKGPCHESLQDATATRCLIGFFFFSFRLHRLTALYSLCYQFSAPPTVFDC